MAKATDKERLAEAEGLLRDSCSIMSSMSYWLSDYIQMRKHHIWMGGKSMLDQQADETHKKVADLIEAQRQFVKKVSKSIK